MDKATLQQAVYDWNNGLETIDDWHRYIATQLHKANIWFGHGLTNGWEEASLLLSELCAIAPEYLSDYGHHRLSHQERQQLCTWLEKRIEERQPAAYLVNRAWFAGLPFYVDERVLVPRSPLAELILNQLQPWITTEPELVLDLCTGSACIAIAAAAQFPEALVHAVDISPDALEVAAINVAEFGLEEQVYLFESDGFSQLLPTQYDVILTNPPYVDEEDMSDLPEEYHHEPELGLASGDDGLDFVRMLLQQASDYLTPDGILICEVGNSYITMQNLWADIPMTWVELEQGGHGVFVMTHQELLIAKEKIEKERLKQQ